MRQEPRFQFVREPESGGFVLQFRIKCNHATIGFLKLQIEPRHFRRAALQFGFASLNPFQRDGDFAFQLAQLIG